MEKVKTNAFTMCRENYKSDEEFERELGRMVIALNRNKQEVLVRYDDCGVYVLGTCYNPFITHYGAPRYMLVTADEEDNILDERRDDSEN